MADQWKATIVPLLGEPIVMLEVTITRAIPLDIGNLNWLTGQMAETGQTEVAKTLRLLQTLPKEAWPFIVAPWSQAQNDEFNLLPINEIATKLSTEAFWRVDGSAESGFVGILNVGAIDRRYPITEETAPALRANIVSMKDATQVEVDEGRMTPAQKQLIDHFCDKATGQLDICAQLTKDYVDAQKVKEKNEKAAKEKAVHDAWEHVKTDTGRVGDFPKDWGGAMGKC